MDFGNCVYGCDSSVFRNVHVFICYSMLMPLRWTHVGMFKCLQACMNMYFCCGRTYMTACVESQKCLRLGNNKLQVWVQRLYASMLRWLYINTVAALFSYSGFRANVWKSSYFQWQLIGAHKFTVLYFYPLHIMKVPEDKTVPARVGWVVESSVGVGGRWLIVVFGDIKEGCNCTGHVAVWEKQLWEVFPGLYLLLKKKKNLSLNTIWANSLQDACLLFQVKSNRVGLNVLKQNGSKFNYTLQAAWQFPLCNTQSNKTALNRPGSPVHTGVSVTRQEGRALYKRPS